MYIPLHTHSYYSLLEGLASPSDLAQAAARLEMPALALTDHNLLSGAIEFYDACREAGVRPILGLQLDIALPPGMPALPRPGSLILLAQDLSGWSNLCRLSSAVQTEGNTEGGLPFDRLAQSSSGLICLSGGRLSWPAAYLLRGQSQPAEAIFILLAELFPGRFYGELCMQDDLDVSWAAPLAALAKKHSIPVALSHPVDYLDPTQAQLQRVVTAIRLNCSVDSLPEGAVAPPGAYLMKAKELAPRYAAQLPQVNFSGLCSTTQEIAERCRLELSLGAPHFPTYELPAGHSMDSLLRQKAEAGARQIYAKNNESLDPIIQARLDHELEVIASCGYASLFLVMEEIIQFVKQNGIPISSRGSAASSLVAHCLGITSPDPVRLNLYFERFLNPARQTPPDIDTDLCSRRRDEVIHFVFDRFGADRVAMVCTVSRFRPRSALREVAKAYGLSTRQIKTLADSLPYRWWRPNAADTGPYTELQGHYSSPPYPSIFQAAAALLGLPDHLSVHPGGIVIAPGPLTDLAPVHLASKGVFVTQFDLDSIERLGLVKIDLLGIRGLTVLGDVADYLSRETSLQVGEAETSADASTRTMRASSAFLESIPEDDPLTSELVQNGDTVGCFQIESPGMRATLKEIQASSIEDILVALALYRPGPLTGGLKDAFVRRHRGQEPVVHLHPALKPLLEDTYGVILYQEQVLRIAHELAGLSLADSDLLRRAMSHFDPGKQMQMLKERFIAGALERNQVPPDVSERVWELMAAFAGYGFPKAHAASYAQVAWRAAWCKTHSPAVFMAAVLANWGGYYGQSNYLSEVRRLGLKVRSPHINYAKREFSVVFQEGQPVLFMGLDQVRDLTRRTIERILNQRPFGSLGDFLARVDPRPVEAENLVRSGALEGLGVIPALLKELEHSTWHGGQMALFSLENHDNLQIEDWTLAEKVAAQEEILGAGVAAHKLELLAAEIAASGAINTLEVAARVGQRVILAGTRQTWRRSVSSRGDFVYYMSLEDLEGTLEVIIYSDVYRRYRSSLSRPGPYLVEGIVERDARGGEPFIKAEKVSLLVN